MNRWRNKNDGTAAARLNSEWDATSSDAELALAARRGDKRAFVEIVARHQSMVCGIALGILGDFAASEDAGQEAFLTAWRKIHELREPERLRQWLGQIARNAALGHLRRRRGHEALEDAPDLADELPAPDEVLANEEEAALVRDSLAKLPENYRLPLILFYREGQSVRAVADSLAISEDAVKQRLARGREMLRDRMSGLVENVLTRTGPTPIFTMAIAAAIGALAAPAVVAGSVFSAAAAAAAGTTSTAASSTSILTAMSTSKALLITAAFVTAVCVPIGYHIRLDHEPSVAIQKGTQVEAGATAALQKAPPSFESSALFAEWKQLHDTYGTTAEAMPSLYEAIADLKDPFRRRAFRTALIAEWVQVDPTNGLEFFLRRRSDASQRRQFFDEWLLRDARAAVDALMASDRAGAGLARDALAEIARRLPERVAEIASRLPKSDSYWDTQVRDAFAIVAEGGLASARAAAEAMDGPNREQALAGVAQAWAKSDLDGALAWARKLPDGTDRDEVIRAALMGKAATDPIAALERVGMVPAGGRQNYFATTTGARVLKEAATADFDATVNWLATHPGRLGREDLLGLANAVTEKLNADAAGFLTQHAASGSLAAILPAIESALLNQGAGQRSAVWDWLKTQPNDETAKELKRQILSSAGYQDPALALQLAVDLPRTPDGDAEVQSLARSLFNGGRALYRFDQLFEQAPERLRQPLIDEAFRFLSSETLDHPQKWVARLALLPEASRARGVESIARAWAAQAPEDAMGWAAALPPGESRSGAVANITSAWAAKDSQGASEWVAAMPAGAERDRSAQSLVLAIAEKFPREAWDWAMSIGDASTRASAANHAAQMMAARDLATARQWIENGPFTPEDKAGFQSTLKAASPSSTPR